MAFSSNTSPIMSEDSNSMTDLDRSNTEDEIHTDTSNWTSTKEKRLQHMMEFHEEYQQIFGEKASIPYHNEEEDFSHESPYSRYCM